MSGNAPLPWKQILATLFRYLPLWSGCAAVFSGLGYAYTQVRTDSYRASQVLLVRNQANGEDTTMGKFGSQTELKAAQETILQLARSREVVLAAMERLGPAPAKPNDPPRETPWPSQDDIDEARANVTIAPPKNSEFGATEVIQLETKELSQRRARDFCEYIREALLDSMKTIRTDKSDSVLQELTEARNLALLRQTEANKKLQEIEVRVGSDLGDLRVLSESYGAQSNSQVVLEDLLRDLRQAELDLQKKEELHRILQLGQTEPGKLLIAGGEILGSQPTLKRLKDGMIDAQLEASKLGGRYTGNHPKMRAAITAQQEILSQIRMEITASIDSVKSQVRVAEERINKLQAKRQELAKRMERLAELRSTYSSVTAEARLRTEQLASAEAALTDAEAVFRSAKSTQLLSPLGEIQVTDKPLGPNDTMVLVSAVAMGTMCGFGLVFLVAPSPQTLRYGRRWSDYAGANPRSDVTSLENVADDDSNKVSDHDVPASAEPGPASDDFSSAVRERVEALASKNADAAKESVTQDRRRNPRN